MRTGFCAALVLLAAACQPRYDGVSIRRLTGDGEFNGREIEIAEGQAMAVEVTLRSSNPYEDYEEFNIVKFESLNETILLVAPADGINRFVAAGARVGTTSVDIVVDGRREDTLRAEVRPQGIGP